MRGINQVTLFGQVATDPNFAETTAGTYCAHFRLVTTDHWYDKDGEPRSLDLWHDVTALGKLAHTVHDYIRRTHYVLVVGQLAYRTIEADDGGSLRLTSVRAVRLEFPPHQAEPEPVESADDLFGGRVDD